MSSVVVFLDHATLGYLVGLPTLAFKTFSTTETKYLCLLHILLHLITTPSTAMFVHCVILCLYILVALMPFGIFK